MRLKNRDREILNKIFLTIDIPLEIWAFGSRVNGDAHDGSDLDLVIRTSNLQKLPLETLNAIKEKIKYSNIPILVEIFDWARIPESFHKNILTSHEVLFSNLNENICQD